MAGVDRGANKQKELKSKIFSAQAIDSEATSGAIDCKQFNLLSLFFAYTNSAATAVTMTVEASPDEGTTWCVIQEIDDGTPPTLTSDTATWSQAVSGDEDWVWNIPVNYKWVRIKVTGTGGDGSDVVDVWGILGNV